MKSLFFFLNFAISKSGCNSRIHISESNTLKIYFTISKQKLSHVLFKINKWNLSDLVFEIN